MSHGCRICWPLLHHVCRIRASLAALRTNQLIYAALRNHLACGELKVNLAGHLPDWHLAELVGGRFNSSSLLGLSSRGELAIIYQESFVAGLNLFNIPVWLFTSPRQYEITLPLFSLWKLWKRHAICNTLTCYWCCQFPPDQPFLCQHSHSLFVSVIRSSLLDPVPCRRHVDRASVGLLSLTHQLK